MPQFERDLGIDHSGVQTPTGSLKGLRLYAATRREPAVVEIADIADGA